MGDQRKSNQVHLIKGYTGCMRHKSMWLYINLYLYLTWVCIKLYKIYYNKRSYPMLMVFASFRYRLSKKCKYLIPVLENSCFENMYIQKNFSIN